MPSRLMRWAMALGAGGLLSIGGLVSVSSLAETGPTYRNFRMSSASMEPTLRNSEMFVARTSSFMPIERGGVYLVRHGEAVHVARVIGLPGDDVEIVGGGVFYEKEAAHYSNDDLAGMSGTCTKGPPLVRREHLPGGASHAVLACDHSFGRDMEPMRIPAGRYFLLGDNRSNAADSRYSGHGVGLGLVAEADFFGKAERIFLSSEPARIGKEID